MPAWALPGPDYDDRGGFGSFGLPAPAQPALPKPELGPRPRLIVTSKKALKWKAALFGLADAGLLDPAGVLEDIGARGLDPDRPLTAEGAALELVTLATPSGVPEQPLGPAEGRRGAEGRAGVGAGPEHPVRAAVAEALNEGRSAVVVSIESYVALEPFDPPPMPEGWPKPRYVSPEGEAAIDRAAILVEIVTSSSAQFVLRTTEGVALPFAYALLSRTSDQAITAGQLMANALGVPHDDWQSRFIPGLDRSALLRTALG